MNPQNITTSDPQPTPQDASTSKARKKINIWEARLYCGDGFKFIGYLVTFSGDPNQPSCIVYSTEHGGGAEADARDLERATLVIDQPWRITSAMFNGIDLRNRELPEWLWALRVLPVIDANGNADEDDNRPLNPFCPIRFADEVERVVDRQYPDRSVHGSLKTFVGIGFTDAEGNWLVDGLRLVTVPVPKHEAMPAPSRPVSLDGLMEIHDRAMGLAGEGDLAGERADLKSAIRLHREAFELERLAVNRLADLHDVEPTRSLIHRSAASLALQLGDHEECRRILMAGLAGRPPAGIKAELQDMLEKLPA